MGCSSGWNAPAPTLIAGRWSFSGNLPQQVTAVERADASDEPDSVSIPSGSQCRTLTQIYAPPGVPVIVENAVTDTIVRQARFTGSTQTQNGYRTVRREVRIILKKYGLPSACELFDRAYAYIRELLTWVPPMLARPWPSKQHDPGDFGIAVEGATSGSAWITWGVLRPGSRLCLWDEQAGGTLLAPHGIKQFLVLLPGGEGGASCPRGCCPLLVLGGVPRLRVPNVLMEREFADGQGAPGCRALSLPDALLLLGRELRQPPGVRRPGVLRNHDDHGDNPGQQRCQDQQDADDRAGAAGPGVTEKEEQAGGEGSNGAPGRDVLPLTVLRPGCVPCVYDLAFDGCLRRPGSGRRLRCPAGVHGLTGLLQRVPVTVQGLDPGRVGPQAQPVPGALITRRAPLARGIAGQDSGGASFVPPVAASLHAFHGHFRSRAGCDGAVRPARTGHARTGTPRGCQTVGQALQSGPPAVLSATAYLSSSSAGLWKSVIVMCVWLGVDLRGQVVEAE